MASVWSRRLQTCWRGVQTEVSADDPTSKNRHIHTKIGWVNTPLASLRFFISLSFFSFSHSPSFFFLSLSHKDPYFCIPVTRSPTVSPYCINIESNSSVSNDQAEVLTAGLLCLLSLKGWFLTSGEIEWICLKSLLIHSQTGESEHFDSLQSRSSVEFALKWGISVCRANTRLMNFFLLRFLCLLPFPWSFSFSLQT